MVHALPVSRRANAKLGDDGDMSGAVMAADERRDELKKFLRDRRAFLSPEVAGLRATGRRRTPGLRREEVAHLAGVSVTWYTWLEQGRDIRCSTDLLRRLSRALKLSVTDTDYLFRLAGFPAPIQAPDNPVVDPSIQGVLDGFTVGPALVMGPRLDVAAFNPRADALFRFDHVDHPLARNQLWRGFMDEDRRRLYRDWDDLMTQGVDLLRANYAARIGDEAFEHLISILRDGSADFARLWERRRPLPLNAAHVRLHTPGLGELGFTSTRMLLPTVTDHVAFFLAPTDEETQRAMSSLREGRARATSSAGGKKVSRFSSSSGRTGEP